jgi:Fe-S-cluster-containing dehydrogenase component
MELTMTKNGLLIDYEYCSGCHSCEVACRNELSLPVDQWGIKLAEDGPRKLPDGGWHWDYIPVPSELCDLCEPRTAKGLEPMCVQSCQAKVMDYGSPEELAKKMEQKGGKVVIFLP